MNERRILCVNCLYGLHRHRSHKVVPLKDCMDEVYEDNKKLKYIMDEEIKKLEYYTKVAEENKAILETEMRKVTNELEREYQIKADELQGRY